MTWADWIVAGILANLGLWSWAVISYNCRCDCRDPDGTDRETPHRPKRPPR